MWDEESPPPPQRINRVALDPMGVAELTSYINELRGEIARVEVAIAAKQDHRGVTDSFFRT
jgi:uncharacterized small protein (DUF1192 family)